MGSYKRSAERAEMEVSNTRFLLTKRRKSTRELQELELTSPDIELEEPRFLSNSLNEAITVAAGSSSSGVVLAAGGGDRCFRLCSGVSSFPRCYGNESCGIVKDSLRFVDLEAKSLETEISTRININKFSRETTPLSSELSGESEEMESREKNPLSSPAKQKPKTPSQAEIDEFFSVNEKYEQKRFTEKYNYDIVKDMPVDGRYQWVRLKP
ncbi:Cyclin-dependent kinase inhibitor 7 [Hibiscus syriacus]|uniref:Cyclin-dependent kinase inhibitor n=1 Tax=Hibiscus syriacus TaxID=106335 RepID=A0A6A3BYQ5_HIBSY|nr:cyclin-dependent kinase inhibitor 7-like [Hibiscus syriacus]XP_039063005.1 cyclin-dependent kinase inhibitor 7-like [Hibiscus syriacus]KAE8721816.1 Cyclin-dependent kinase inhibitor 7 [Hibiscus syriacus]